MLDSKNNWRQVGRAMIPIVAAFVVVAWASSLRTALLAGICFVMGYLNEFYLVNPLLSFIRFRKMSIRTVLVGMLAVLLNIGFIYFHSELLPIVGMTMAMFFLIDAFVLKFK